ncbi:uncharacterized protein LOC142173716 [Nicotiana tabacum]|uniref:Uncharacterized protein LOC142173716 n=1 Tax=Nicotiana tabacum TaxID=4097 RepID=A0AC58TE31_TOBAC
MGLNEVYTVVRGSILMMNQLPNIAQAFSILIREEKQREVRPNNNLVMESTSLSANGPGNAKFKTNYNQRGGSTGPNPYNSNKSNYLPAKSQMFCDFCKKPRHTRDKCYRIHGFPQDFKFTKGRNAASAANVRVDCEEMEEGNQSKGLQSLTNEQYNQLLSLLEKFPGKNTREGPKNNMTYGAANFAGILACSTYKEIAETTMCRCSKSIADLWILDSGASNHMTYRKSFLKNVRTLPYPFLVTLPNGYRVKVTEIGDASLGPMLTLVRSGSFSVPVNLCSRSFFPALTDVVNTGKSHNPPMQSLSSVNESSQSHNNVNFSTSVKIVRSDNGLEFVNNEAMLFFQEKGYPFGTKGYKVLDLATKRVHVSTDAMFHEDVFPFAISPEHSSFPYVLHMINHNFPCPNSIVNTLDDYCNHDRDASTSVTESLISDTPYINPLSNSTSTPNHISHIQARLVMKGYTQEAGIDYTETFSPVVKMTTVRALISIVVKKGWDLYQLNVNNVFLHGDLHEEGESSVFVVVYVDDAILIGTNLEKIKAPKTYLHNQIKIKDLGKLHYFLGLEMLYNDDGVWISQRKFTTDLLKEYDCLGYSVVSSPLDSSTKLRAE